MSTFIEYCVIAHWGCVGYYGVEWWRSAECLGLLFRGYFGIVSQISGAPRLNRGLKYSPKPLRHQYSGPDQSQKKAHNLLDEIFAHVIIKIIKTLRQCYMWFSTSNESSWAYKFNYPIVMTVNISRCAGIDRQLHPLKAKDLIKDNVNKIDGKNYMRE